MRKLILLFVLFIGCHSNPKKEVAKKESRPMTAIETFEVDYIFTFGGARVYRFYDAGNWRYYAVSDSSITVSAEHTERKNKQNVDYIDNITTVK